MGRRAVFLDRDNTIIADPGYISDPGQVKLLTGAGAAIKRLNEAGFAVVLVTNQSGLARGKFDEQALSSVHERLEALLAEQGAKLDGIYYCPYLEGDEAVVEKYRKRSNLRKPAPGMLLQAANEMGLSLSQSWMIGDSSRDVLAGQRAGCRTVLIGGNAKSADGCRPDHRARSLDRAVELILGHELAASQKAATEGNADSVGEAVALLRDIRDRLALRERTEQQDDFSVVRLIATFLQMLAVVACVMGLMSVFNGQTTDAVVRFLLSIFLQVATLTAYHNAPK